MERFTPHLQIDVTSVRFLRLFSLVSTLFLAGCWISSKPLLDDGNASEIPFVGEYASPDGGTVPVTISKNGQSASYEISMGADSLAMHLLELGSEWFVLQIVDPIEEPQEIDIGTDLKGTRKPTNIATYRLVNFLDGNVRIYEPQCTEQLAVIPGVKKNEIGCVFDNVEALAAAAKLMADMVRSGSLELDFDELKPFAPREPNSE